MTEQIDSAPPRQNADPPNGSSEDFKPAASRGVPSNEVYARVGDTVMSAARDGVRRGLRPEDILREIRDNHRVHLTLGELRLLLAARRLPE